MITRQTVKTLVQGGRGGTGEPRVWGERESISKPGANCVLLFKKAVYSNKILGANVNTYIPTGILLGLGRW